jgi:hypothetical protein
LQQKSSKANTAYTADKKQQDKINGELVNVKEKLSHINFSETEYNSLAENIGNLENEGNKYQKL